MMETLSTSVLSTHGLVARYGDFVRYKPALNARTWLLWYGPAGLLLGGLLLLGLIVLRKRRAQSALATQTLTAEEQARLDALLNHDSRKGTTDA